MQREIPVRSDWSKAPAWFQWALHEIGVHELGNNSGPDLKRYRDLAKCGSDGDPWCAIFANAAFEVNGFPGTGSALARSFAQSHFFKALGGPALGCVAVFWRGSKSGNFGHVGFYRGETDTHILTLGGNENDQVEIAAYPKESRKFGLLGYYWPSRIVAPYIVPVPIRAGLPLVQSSAI